MDRQGWPRVEGVEVHHRPRAQADVGTVNCQYYGSTSSDCLRPAVAVFYDARCEDGRAVCWRHAEQMMRTAPLDYGIGAMERVKQALKDG